MTVFEMIEAQQKGKEDTAVFMVGEQLKDICRAEPGCAEIVAKDLEVAAMSIAECEKKVKAQADEIQKKSKSKSVGLSGAVADRIIREFYGLPAAGEKAAPVAAPVEQELDLLDLGDLLM